MRSVRLALLGLCVALATSCGDNLKPAAGPDAGVTPPADDAGPPPGTASVRFAESLDAAADGVFSESFPLFEQRDVIAVVSVPLTGGVQVLRLQMLGPSGAPVRTIWRAFTTAATAPTDPVPHPRTGAPMYVETINAEQGMARLRIEIPIGGTNLTQYRLLGTYVVGIYVDQQPTPACAGSFELRGAP